ncbi:MAG: ankyrin repeat domain-containing protein [Ardenticatenaceae bacterium]|nr:ankyrin repeat domain-containing protein [Ardenticatenaceae bacterium]
MTQETLFAAVRSLADSTQAFTDVDMAQPFHWHQHREGVRLGLIGTYHELRDLAATLTNRRVQAGPATSLAQQVLGQVHMGYRELQAVLLGVTAEMFEKEPATAEWPLRITLGHIIAAERTFYTLIKYGQKMQAEGAERPFPFPADEVEKLNGSNEVFYDLIDNQPLPKIMAYYDEFHERVRQDLISLPDDIFLGPSPVWWEEEEYTLQYRLHRFDAHLRQHLVQIEKTLGWLEQPQTEARRFLRLIFRAVAGVENAVLGSPELGLAERQALAQTIQERTAVLQQVVADCHKLETAVNDNQVNIIQQITGDQPALANALGTNGISLLMNAIYQRKTAVIDALLAAEADLDVFAAAALGNLARLQALAEKWPGYLNLFAKDGFTPLQLACYFDQEAAALWLIEQEADVRAVAKNNIKITPLHATVTHGNLTIARALLEKGADVNAAQAGGFTAVHQAAHRNNVPLAELLLAFGADPHQPDEKGQTALQMAKAEGNEAVTAVLSHS